MYHNTIEVDLAKIAHNFKELRTLAPPPREFLAVVKADAYGHGSVPVSRRLEQLGCENLAVFRLEEAAQLRDAGLTRPIFVLMGLMEEECNDALEYDVTPIVYHWDNAYRLNEAASIRNRTVNVHVKVDTGMNRLGVPFTDAEELLEKLLSLRHINVDGIISHLSSAEDPEDAAYTHEQIEKFKTCLAAAKRMGHHPVRNHVCNSAASPQGLDLDSELVRPGLTLYGSIPGRALQNRVQLEPVMSFHSRVIQVKRVPPGTSISYNRRYITDRESIIATIPVGYDDGYFRAFSNRAEVLIRGVRCPVRGSVCMNLIMVDVTHNPHVCVGDPVVLLGAQGDERITAEELAGLVQTISYEIYTSLGSQNRRVYFN